MNTICMIRPPRVFLDGSFSVGSSVPPIGMAYLNACLEKEAFDVVAIDAIGEDIDRFYQFEDVRGIVVQGMYLEEIVARIPDNALFIGISCMFSSEWIVHEALTTLIKKKFPEVPIILGGEHATAESSNILKSCSSVDICVSGEGELTIVELSHAIKNKTSWREIKGLSFVLNGEVIKNPARSRIKDINTIPNPSWKNIPVQNYHHQGKDLRSPFRATMPVIASRGCPFRCTFCTSPQMWGTDLNLRSPESVIEEVKIYKEMYAITHIDFLDIVGVLNKAWIKDLLNLWIKSGLDLTWSFGSGTRSEILDDEVLELFKNSQVSRIQYAPESGSKETIKRIQKRVNLKKMVKSMRKAQALGISMKAPLIYGFPGQTLKEAFQSVFFGFRLAIIGVDDVVAHSFSAHPGTELHNDLVASGIINMNPVLEKERYHHFLANEAQSKVTGLKSWSEHIPNWFLPFLQHGSMAMTYVILFLFHPKKLVLAFKRAWILRKPVTAIEHLLFDLVIAKRAKINSPPRNLKAYYL